MSFIGGYQSNIHLSDLNIVGDFPVDHSIGGFGIGLGLNDYSITLNTAITGYRQGLLLQVMFAGENTGAVRVNVSGCGLKPLRKPSPGSLSELGSGEISVHKVYLIVYDGQVFQLVNVSSTGSSAVPDATETEKGIARIATLPETMAGEDNSKIVTPAKLTSYVAARITGLWKDKGLIDCSLNPNYPAGIAGEAYTVNGAGRIGGAAGQNVGLRDVLYCNATNAGGPEAIAGSSWTILQANLEAASELVAGYVRLSTLNEVNTGVSLTTAVSPQRLKDLLNLVLRFQNGAAVGSIIPRAGTGNIASGNYAAVLSGEYNQASGAYSIAEGRYAASVLYNEWAKAGNSFYNVRGSAQCSILNLMTIVPPGTTAVPITPDGGHAGEYRWGVPVDSVQQFRMQLTIVQNDGLAGAPGLTWTGVYEGAVRNQGGFVYWVGGEPAPKDIYRDFDFSPESGFIFGPDEIVPYVNAMLERNLHVNATVYITQTKFSLS